MRDTGGGAGVGAGAGVAGTSALGAGGGTGGALVPRLNSNTTRMIMTIPEPTSKAMSQEGVPVEGAGAGEGSGVISGVSGSGPKTSTAALAPFKGASHSWQNSWRGGDAHAALGAEGVSLFRMEQEATAHAAIALAIFIRGLTVRALGHTEPPAGGNQIKEPCIK